MLAWTRIILPLHHSVQFFSSHLLNISLMRYSLLSIPVCLAIKSTPRQYKSMPSSVDICQVLPCSKNTYIVWLVYVIDITLGLINYGRVRYSSTGGLSSAIVDIYLQWSWEPHGTIPLWAGGNDDPQEEPLSGLALNSHWSILVTLDHLSPPGRAEYTRPR